MAVNLSPRQFQDGDVVPDVVAALEETGFPAAQLPLEVTEGVLVQDVDAVVAQLEALRALGIRIAIDDFGTGFSACPTCGTCPPTSSRSTAASSWTCRRAGRRRR